MDKKVKRRKISFINAMRKAFVLCDTYNQVLDAALVDEVGPRGGARYQCSTCNQLFAKSQMEIDHYIEPLTPFHLYQYQMSERMVIERLFCDITNLRACCKPCHKAHSNEQMKLRKAAKKKAAAASSK